MLTRKTEFKEILLHKVTDCTFHSFICGDVGCSTVRAYSCWTRIQKRLLNLKISFTSWNGDNCANKRGLVETRRSPARDRARRPHLWWMRQDVSEADRGKSLDAGTSADVRSMSTLHDESVRYQFPESRTKRKTNLHADVKPSWRRGKKWSQVRLFLRFSQQT